MSAPRETDRAARRRQLIGLAHLGASQLGLDEDSRRAAQAAWTGHDSCADMSDRELVAWCWELKRRGADIGIPAPRPRPRVGAGLGRPTPAQLARIEALAAALGLSEPALGAFSQRTCGVDDPRWLRRSQASDLISGLNRWALGRGLDTSSGTRQAVERLLADEPQPAGPGQREGVQTGQPGQPGRQGGHRGASSRTRAAVDALLAEAGAENVAENVEYGSAKTEPRLQQQLEEAP